MCRIEAPAVLSCEEALAFGLWDCCGPSWSDAESVSVACRRRAVLHLALKTSMVLDRGKGRLNTILVSRENAEGGLAYRRP